MTSPGAHHGARHATGRGASRCGGRPALRPAPVSARVRRRRERHARGERRESLRPGGRAALQGAGRRCHAPRRAPRSALADARRARSGDPRSGRSCCRALTGPVERESNPRQPERRSGALPSELSQGSEATFVRVRTRNARHRSQRVRCRAPPARWVQLCAPSAIGVCSSLLFRWRRLGGPMADQPLRSLGVADPDAKQRAFRGGPRKARGDAVACAKSALRGPLRRGRRTGVRAERGPAPRSADRRAEGAGHELVGQRRIRFHSFVTPQMRRRARIIRTPTALVKGARRFAPARAVATLFVGARRAPLAHRVSAATGAGRTRRRTTQRARRRLTVEPMAAHGARSASAGDRASPIAPGRRLHDATTRRSARGVSSRPRAAAAGP